MPPKRLGSNAQILEAAHVLASMRHRDAIDARASAPRHPPTAAQLLAHARRLPGGNHFNVMQQVPYDDLFSERFEQRRYGGANPFAPHIAPLMNVPVNGDDLVFLETRWSEQSPGYHIEAAEKARGILRGP